MDRQMKKGTDRTETYITYNYNKNIMPQTSQAEAYNIILSRLINAEWQE